MMERATGMPGGAMPRPVKRTAERRTMVLNTWTVRWNGREIEVRNHFFVAELLVDGRHVVRVPGVFRHELRATLNGHGPNGTPQICQDQGCRHSNKPEAQFCANCGAELKAEDGQHDLLATVVLHFPPHIGCRILVDGREILKED
jgi:hypothetical protein